MRAIVLRRLMIGAALLTLSIPAALADERIVTLAVEGMTCGLCPLTVTTAIEGVEGVLQVSVDYDAKRAIVRYDGTATTAQEIAEASTSAGYPARMAE
jgi:mercuric ion binding protein